MKDHIITTVAIVVVICAAFFVILVLSEHYQTNQHKERMACIQTSGTFTDQGCVPR